MSLSPSVVLTYYDILSQSQPDVAQLLYFDNLFTTIILILISQSVGQLLFAEEKRSTEKRERCLPIILLHAVGTTTVQ